ncbi:hypothetical protein [Defluviimonas salinarum]|uniref:ABC transporter permease n=1 Tax=Defluviimonas salinarum TaxID=2992147 RepID=A0ABT3J791_9RHOB|nr:hypothetical protein [Defluviimonas salinarum]MCW3783561.1 hypothetical protein [Defluviimonas salinarum]
MPQVPLILLSPAISVALAALLLSFGLHRRAALAALAADSHVREFLDEIRGHDARIGWAMAATLAAFFAMLLAGAAIYAPGHWIATFQLSMSFTVGTAIGSVAVARGANLKGPALILLPPAMIVGFGIAFPALL